jgi:hypothetical protein
VIERGRLSELWIDVATAPGLRAALKARNGKMASVEVAGVQKANQLRRRNFVNRYAVDRGDSWLAICCATSNLPLFFK